MLKCIIENAKGNQLEFNDETKYQLYEVDGLYPPNASIMLVMVQLLQTLEYHQEILFFI